MSGAVQQRPVMLIVGAEPGMGRAVALLAAQRGMDVALVPCHAQRGDIAGDSRPGRCSGWQRIVPSG